jgi:hypothetical protein
MNNHTMDFIQTMLEFSIAFLFTLLIGMTINAIVVIFDMCCFKKKTNNNKTRFSRKRQRRRSFTPPRKKRCKSVPVHFRLNKTHKSDDNETTN